jgi:hypothetical protein
VTWGAVLTLATRFTRLAWLTRFTLLAGFLRGLLVFTRLAVVGVFC